MMNELRKVEFIQFGPKTLSELGRPEKILGPVLNFVCGMEIVQLGPSFVAFLLTTFLATF